MVKSIVNRFKYVIFIRFEVPAKIVLSQSDGDRKIWRNVTLKNFEIVSKLRLKLSTTGIISFRAWQEAHANFCFAQIWNVLL